MKKLGPCFAGDGGSSSSNEGCDDTMKDEVADVHAFRRVVADFLKSSEDGKPRTTAALAMLHNIVTSTVSDKFSPERHRYYCVADVIDQLQRSAIFESNPHRLNASVLQPSFNLGFGPHRLKNCSL